MADIAANRPEMEVQSNQVFVRNLSYETTKEDLVALFQDVGPIKHAEVTRDASTGASRGFGFVKFSLDEDAAAAVTKLHGSSLKGRKMLLELAVKKVREKKAKKGDGASASVDTKERAADTGATGASKASAMVAAAPVKVKETGEKEKPKGKAANVPPPAPVPSAKTSVKPPANPPAAVKEQKTAPPAKQQPPPPPPPSKAVGKGKAAPKQEEKEEEEEDDSDNDDDDDDDDADDDNDEDDEDDDDDDAETVEMAIDNKPAKRTTTASSSSSSSSSSAAAAASKSAAEGTAPSGSVKPSLQVLLLGAPVDLKKSALQRVAKKVNRKAALELIKEGHVLCDQLGILCPAGKIFLMTAPSREVAKKLIAKFDGASAKLLGLVPEDAPSSSSSSAAANAAAWKAKMVARSLANLTAPALRKRHCRLIVRNLSFEATEANVTDKLSTYGPLVEVTIPRVAVAPTPRTNQGKNGGRGGGRADKGERLHSRGFAFVTFLCSIDAAAAVKQSADAAATTAAAGEGGDAKAVKALKVCNREVAVDYCERKDRYEGGEEGEGEAGEEAERGKADAAGEDDIDENDEDDDEEGGEGGDGDDGDDEEDDDDDDESDVVDGEGDESDLEDGGDAEEDDDADDNEKEAPADAHEGCTVFIRGLSLETEKRDLLNAARPFGTVLLALLTRDGNGNNRGSAFIKFASSDAASACVDSSNKGAGLLVRDRACRCDLAVDKDQAKRLKEEQHTKRDKRLLYLANEGLSLGPEEAKDMPEEEKDKRRRAQQEKKKKLLNPLFCVSATRLSVRNLSKTTTDATLKTLCLAACKKGIERKLVNAKDAEALRLAQGMLPSAPTPLQPPGKGAIKSAKVMLDLARVRGGLPQSRGHAFVEFSSHVHALACLRELNNNTNYTSSAAGGSGDGGSGGKGASKGRPRLIVEFSLENMQKVLLLRAREERMQKRREQQLQENQASGKAASKAKAGKESDKWDKAAKRKREQEQGGQQDDDAEGEDGDDDDDDDANDYFSDGGDNDGDDGAESEQASPAKKGPQANKKAPIKPNAGAAPSAPSSSSKKRLAGSEGPPDKKPPKKAKIQAEATSSGAESATDSADKKVKKAKKDKRKAFEKKRAEKVEARKARQRLEAAGGSAQSAATTGPPETDGAAAGAGKKKRKGQFGRLRAEKKAKKAAAVETK